MNRVTVAQIKRGGFAVLDAALVHGPVHLMKRNRPSAVLLSEADYSALSASATSVDANSERAWRVLTDPTIEPLGLNAEQMAARLGQVGVDWSDR